MLGVKRNLDDDNNEELLINNNVNEKKKFKKDHNVILAEKKSTTTTTKLGYKYLNVTSSFSGKRISKKLLIDKINDNANDENELNEIVKNLKNQTKSSFGDLLGKPFTEILKELEDFEAVKFKSKLLQENEIKKNEKKDPSTTTTTKTDNKLWVDKYSPESFHDLLSDDTMNIEILKWLKLWDYVLNKSKEVPKDIVMPASFSNNSNINNPNNKYNNQLNTQLNNQFKKAPAQQEKSGSGSSGGGAFFQQKHTTTTSSSSSSSTLSSSNHNHYLLQEDRTPIIKVILLTGGPGLGKTTLAHVLAKHAGFDTVEINASDCRSGEDFEKSLLPAIENNTSAFSKKPNCVIVDEIDGISGRDNGPIDLICKLIDNSIKLGNTSKKSSTNKSTKKGGDDSDNDDDDSDNDQQEDEDTENQDKKRKNKKKNNMTRLLRPIICICNDQYVPSLRKLRQKAQVFNFSAPKKQQLLSRLKEICLHENLTASDSTLSSLIEMTGSDIRACINSLQFIKSKTSVLNSTLLNKSNIVIGQKDIEKGLFEIWNMLFKNTTIKTSTTATSASNKNNSNNNSNGSSSSSSSSEFNLIIDSCNQIDKLMDGIHENYLTNMTSDFSLEKTVECLEWMEFSDLVGHYDQYKSIVPLAINQRCSSYQPKIVMPHSEYDNYIKKKSTSTIRDSFFSELPARVHSNLKKNLFTVDFIYPFFDILSIPIRVSNTHLYSLKEKDQLNNLIELMKYYHLTYKIEKSISSQYSKDKDNNKDKIQYKLEPPIDQLLTFSNPTQQSIQHNKYFDTAKSLPTIPNIKHIRLSNDQKQIILTSLQQYKLNKNKDNQSSNNNNNNKPSSSSSSSKDQHFKQPITTPNKPSAPTVLKDFFGRVIQTSPEQKRALQSENKGMHIKYKFQEGFTNAVKKSVYVKDFL